MNTFQKFSLTIISSLFLFAGNAVARERPSSGYDHQYRSHGYEKSHSRSHNHKHHHKHNDHSSWRRPHNVHNGHAYNNHRIRHYKHHYKQPTFNYYRHSTYRHGYQHSKHYDIPRRLQYYQPNYYVAKRIVRDAYAYPHHGLNIYLKF